MDANASVVNRTMYIHRLQGAPVAYGSLIKQIAVKTFTGYVVVFSTLTCKMLEMGRNATGRSPGKRVDKGCCFLFPAFVSLLSDQVQNTVAQSYMRLRTTATDWRPPPESIHLACGIRARMEPNGVSLSQYPPLNVSAPPF